MYLLAVSMYCLGDQQSGEDLWASRDLQWEDSPAEYRYRTYTPAGSEHYRERQGKQTIQQQAVNTTDNFKLNIKISLQCNQMCLVHFPGRITHDNVTWLIFVTENGLILVTATRLKIILKAEFSGHWHFKAE